MQGGIGNTMMCVNVFEALYLLLCLTVTLKEGKARCKRDQWRPPFILVGVKEHYKE